MKKLFVSLIALFAFAPVGESFSPQGYVQVNPPSQQAGGPNTATSQTGALTAGTANITSLSAGTITDTGLVANQCVQTGAGGLLTVTGSACGAGGGGGGGGGFGTVNTASQYSSPYYSVAGSSNVLVGLAAGTSGQILTTGGTGVAPYWSSFLGNTGYIQNTSSLQSGATFYVSSGTVSGPLQLLGNVALQAATLNINSPSGVAFNKQAGASFYDSGGANSAEIQAPTAIGTSYLLQLPSAQGANQMVMQNNGLGQLSWATPIYSTSVLQSGTTFYTSSGTVAGPLAVNALTAGTIQGASLSACGDTSHALSWNSGLFGCQTISGGGNSILNQATLQAGATFYVSSGTVATQLTVGGGNSSQVQLNPTGFTAYTSPSPNINPIGTLTLTQTSLNGSPKGFRFDNPNTGSWVWGIDTIDTVPTSYIGTTLIVSSAASFTSPLQSTFTYGLTMGSGTVNGTGNGNIQLTISGSTYSVTSTSNTGGGVTVGDVAVFASTNGTLVDGGTKGSGGGGGTPASPSNSVQYNNGGSFGGSNNFQWNGTSVTVQSSTTFVNNGTASPIGGLGFVDIYNGATGIYTGKPLFNVGSANQNNQLTVYDSQAIHMNAFGATIGQLTVGETANSPNFSIATNQTNDQFINYWNSGEMDIQTGTTANGGLNIVLKPNTVSEVVVSSMGVTISTSVTINTPAPTVGTCGTLPSINSKSTNYGGSITWSGAATVCGFTFSVPFNNPPFCLANTAGTAYTEEAGVSKSSATFVFSGSLTGSTMTWHCDAGSGG